MQLSYISTGPRTARKLGSQFMTGISYLSTKGKSVRSTVSSSRKDGGKSSGGDGSSSSKKPMTGATYTAPDNSKNKTITANNIDSTKSKPRTPTGTTSEAPKIPEINKPIKTEEAS